MNEKNNWGRRWFWLLWRFMGERALYSRELWEEKSPLNHVILLLIILLPQVRFIYRSALDNNHVCPFSWGPNHQPSRVLLLSFQLEKRQVYEGYHFQRSRRWYAFVTVGLFVAWRCYWFLPSCSPFCFDDFQSFKEAFRGQGRHPQCSQEVWEPHRMHSSGRGWFPCA